MDTYQKRSLGKFYTPGNIVDIVLNLIRPYYGENIAVLDPACGNGAFLNKRFKIIGADIDRRTVKHLKDNGYPHIVGTNALNRIYRYKYGIGR